MDTDRAGPRRELQWERELDIVSRRPCWFAIDPVPSLRAADIGVYQDGAIVAPCWQRADHACNRI